MGGGGGGREADVVVGVYARLPQRKKTLETSETPCTCFVAIGFRVFFFVAYISATGTHTVMGQGQPCISQQNTERMFQSNLVVPNLDSLWTELFAF